MMLSQVMAMGLTPPELTLFAIIFVLGLVAIVLALSPWYHRKAPTKSPSQRELNAAEQRLVPTATIIQVHHFHPRFVRVVLLTNFDGSVECVTHHDPSHPIEFGMTITKAQLARVGLLRRSDFDWWLFGWETLR